MSKSKINPKGSSWDELEKQLFTSEEIAESEVRVAIINEMIKARELQPGYDFHRTKRE